MNKLEKIIAAISIAVIPGCLAVHNGYRGPPRHGCAYVNSSNVASVATVTSSTTAPINTIMPQFYEPNDDRDWHRFESEEVDNKLYK